MKHLPSVLYVRYLYLLAATLVFAGALQSCRKDSVELSYVRVFNLTEDSIGKVDFLCNNDLFIGGVQYGYASGYEKVPSGNCRFSVQAGSATSTDSLLPVSNGQYYSLICYDSPDSIHYNMVRDELTEPAAGKAQVRFFHLNKALGASDIYIGGNLVFQSRTYNDQLSAVARQQFASIDSGRYDIQIKAAGSSTPLYTIPNVPFSEGATFTVITYRELSGGFKAAVYGH